MRHSLLALSIAALLAGCNPAQETKTTTTPAAAEAVTAAETKAALSESERLNQWFETKYEEQLQMSPLQMTFLGRKDKQDQIDDVTEEAEDKQLAWAAASVEELKSQFDYSKLDTEAKTSYDLWIYQYEQSRDAAAFRVNTYVFNQMQGVHALLPQVLMNFHKVDEVVDMEAYVKRIGGIAKAIADLQQRAAKYAEAGVRPPRFAYEGVLEQVNNLLDGAPFKESDKDAPLWADAKAKVEALKKSR